MIIQGSGPYLQNDICIEFQNEFVIARSVLTTDVLATTPDLITVVDTDLGEPITTDELKYGLRISVVVLPASPLMTTEQALKFVGPKCFKCNGVEYKKLCEFREITPIPTFTA